MCLSYLKTWFQKQHIHLLHLCSFVLRQYGFGYNGHCNGINPEHLSQKLKVWRSTVMQKNIINNNNMFLKQCDAIKWLWCYEASLLKISNKAYSIISQHRQWRHLPWGDLKVQNMWWEVHWKNLATFIFNFYRVWSTFSYSGVNPKKRNQNCKFRSFFSSSVHLLE